MLFGGFFDTPPHLGVKYTSKTSKEGPNRHLQAKLAKSKNLHKIIENYCIDSNKNFARVWITASG